MPKYTVDEIYVGTTKIRPPSRPADLSGLLSDIVVYYPMYGTLEDVGPNGWDLSSVTGSFSDKVYYNSMSAFKGRNTSATFNTNDSHTLSCRVRCPSGIPDQNLLCLGSDGAGDGGWGGVVNKRGGGLVINNAYYSVGNVTSITSSWYMVTQVFDYTGRSIELYIDGELELVNSSIPASGGIRGGHWIQFGSPAGGSSGNVTADVGISFVVQNAMTQAEIRQFYNASKGIYL